MTFKQIAEAAKCSERTVRRYARSNWPERTFTTKYGADLNEADSILLMGLIPKRNMVSTGQPTGQLSGRSDLDRLDRLEAMVEKLIGAVATLAIQAPRSNVSALPAPSLVPDIPIRKQIVNLVNDYSVNFNGGQFEATWRRLYREFGDRYGMDVKARASHRGIKPIEYLEREGLLESLYLVAIAVLGRGVA